MNNLTKIFCSVLILTLITACGGESDTAQESALVPAPAPVPTPEPAPEPAPTPELEVVPEPENFEIIFDETNFEVQYDKSLVVPFTLIKNMEHSVEIDLSTPPSLGEVKINVNTFEYTPSGILGEDTLTLSISDDENTVEQEVKLLVSDRSPHLVLSDPIYGLSTELKDGVTVWGYNLGDQQNDSTIELCDLAGQCLAMPSITHWKNTESNLPSTLEELSTSQTIQEVNFSIPETSHGEKYILIKNQFGSTTLPFTVRPKTFEIAFDETNFEVQFDQDITIPLNITLDEGNSVITSLSTNPSIGTATIIDNKINYIPLGTLGKDSLTISITDNNKTIEQKLEFLVSDRAPHLAFSDLISGPSKGLGDKKGSGVIVTVWGFKLGESQGNSIVELCDLDNACSEAAHVYYWKNADGQLPSGPANLYESHGMQEIAFSIPNISNGEKNIKVSNDFGSSTLPFTVRDGLIYHVTSQGNDESGNGSFEKPWLTVAKADSIIGAGSTLYIHDVTTGNENTSQVIYNNRGASMSSLEAQFSYVSYPNTRPEAIGHRVFSVYAGSTDTTKGFVISKLSLFAADSDEDEFNQPINSRGASSYAISGTADGRAIGNYITDAHPEDLTGACPDAEQAAITAGALETDGVSNFKVLGNHIKDYGCDGTSRFQHTTYLTIRSGSANRQLVAPEMAWNYLQNNQASSGLHYFDENHSGKDCGQFTTPFNIHDNFVINQAGPAITIGAGCPVNTTFNIYNNVAINVGLKADFDSETSNSGMKLGVLILDEHIDFTSTINFDHNIFYNISTDAQVGDDWFVSCIGLSSAFDKLTINWNANVCYTELDIPFLASNYLGDSLEAKFTGANNVWYTSTASPIKSIVPSWDTNPIITDPLFIIDRKKVEVSANSPLIGKSENTLLRDIYGQLRITPSTTGAVEISNRNN